MEFNWFDHVYALFLLVGIPILSLRGNQDEEEDVTEFLPPKKHLFYTNGLMLLIGAMLVLTSWNISNRPWHEAGIAWPEYNKTSLILLGLLCGYYLADLVYGWVNRRETAKKISELSFMVPVTWTEFRHFLFLAFAAGIGEEIIFRGFLIPYLTSVLPGWPGQPWIAIAIPAIAFALSHIYQGWWAVIKIAGLAVGFGILFLETGSLLPVILLHILIDIISGLSGVFYMQHSYTDQQIDES